MIFVLLLWSFLFWDTPWTQAETSPPPVKTPSTEEDPLLKDSELSSYGPTGRLFRSVRPSVFQIKTGLAANSPKASYGSAFVISLDGLLVTNYHVVASALQDKEALYKIFLISKAGSIEAKIIGIDTTNDLALLKVDRKFKSALKVASRPMKKGDKIFSVGLPKDLNVSITEGNYNGTIKYGVYEQIHMSSPINSGMSGGPTVNRKGEVVGVNVSVLLNSQNISFSVPAKFIDRLKEKADLRQDLKKEVDGVVENQLLAVQESLMEDMKKNLSEIGKIENWTITPPSRSLKCWSNFRNEPVNTYIKNHQYCSLKSKSYISEGFYSGDYEIQYLSLTNKKRNPWQFSHLLNDLYNASDENLDSLIHESIKNLLTRPECAEKIVVNNHKIPLKVNFCLQAYVDYPQLNILMLKAVTLLKGNHALILRANLRGFTRKSIKEFIQFHLADLKNEPPKPEG